MFGIEQKVERVRQALIKGMRTKAIEIMTSHADKKPADIPRHDLARSMVLNDLAEILVHLRVEPLPNERSERDG
jgi:hypothetical protein